MRGPSETGIDGSNCSVDWEDADIVGVLGKKSADHGIFEDPYQARVRCWLKGGYFHISPLSSDWSDELESEILSLDITKCKVRCEPISIFNRILDIIWCRFSGSERIRAEYLSFTPAWSKSSCALTARKRPTNG